MSHRAFAIGGAATVVVALVAYAAFEAGIERGRTKASGIVAASNATRSAPSAAANASPAKAGDVDPSSGKRVLYWHDPMVPGPRFDKPGKSPFMDMDLVPVYADDAPGGAGVAINPRLQQNLGVRTAKAVAGSFSSSISAVGNVAYNERDVVVVQARSNGFVEKLHIRAALDPVRKGQALAELYVPEWVAAQEEYLAAKRLRTDVDALALGGLADAAAQRMRLAGMSDDQIREVDARGAVQLRFTITSPINGVVGELSAREGMTVAAGAPLFRLNGLSTVWVNAEVPEGAAAEVRPGSAVEARTPALPASVFKGRVGAILPEVNATTRTLKARIELANPDGRLVPGMFATIDFAPTRRSDIVLVPSEAVIRTGKRTVVIVAQGDGRFAPVDVATGIESNGQTEIRKGVNAGDSVVVSGQFLIDSEANLKAATTRMGEMPANAANDTRASTTGERNMDHAPAAQHGAPPRTE
ncbi:MAG: efflux RND transporter periplasmic adaptor subunit [Betaproteobacteria bacterium]|nr:MAG: efflux RND transporter periplasmic adaptor subunit [Betaproteobacteria bacterium]